MEDVVLDAMERLAQADSGKSMDRLQPGRLPHDQIAKFLLKTLQEWREPLYGVRSEPYAAIASVAATKAVIDYAEGGDAAHILDAPTRVRRVVFERMMQQFVIHQANHLSGDPGVVLPMGLSPSGTERLIFLYSIGPSRLLKDPNDRSKDAFPGSMMN